MSGKYILDENNNPLQIDDLAKWGKWMQTADRHVAKDEIDGVTVSTVFLGLDHSYGNGPLELYETMIFGGPIDKYQERYCTRCEADLGHKNAIKKVLESA